MDSSSNSSPLTGQSAASDAPIHIPVLPNEVMQYADPQPAQTWVDGTAGAGGHSRLILERIGPDGRLMSIDRDASAAQHVQQLLPDATVIQASYADLPELLERQGWDGVDGILLDLGLSSDQLADADRGFSFQSAGSLDMRFDTQQGQPVWQWLRSVPEKQLADIIYQFGEERFSRRIARRIVEARRREPIARAEQLRELIYQAIPGARRSTTGSRRHGRVDPATRTFQALRIYINGELEALEEALKRLPSCLHEGGKLLIISFHSLEDRLVKHAFRGDERLQVITKKPVQASDQEIAANSRARSAKLRVAERKSA